MGDTTPLSPHLTELARHVREKIAELQEPLNYAGWSILPTTGSLESMAACEAEPEYKRMRLFFDLEKLQTGDEVDEIIVHEMMHGHTMPTFDLAERYSDLVADMAPEHMREPLRASLHEEVRLAGEDVATQVGFVVVKLLRRLWAAENELANAQAEVRGLKKQLKALDKSAHIG